MTSQSFERVLVVMLAGAACVAGAQQKAAVSDAQVEANVLRALAGAPELSTQNIQTTTVYGVVTLSGSATDEASRTKAENLAARADGVQKVVDQLTLSTDATPAVSAAAPAPSQQPGPGMVLQSDGTYAPAPADDSSAQQQTAPMPQQNSAQQATEQGTNAPAAPPANKQASGNYPAPPPANAPYAQRRPMYNNGAPYPGAAPYANVQGGQAAGKPVVVPAGTMVRIRINQGLTTKHAQAGEAFDGTVLTDIVADGSVAIPRGAQVRGTVIKVEDAGALKGRGELSLQLTQLTMGGQQYPLVSKPWERDGKDKSLHTVNSALGLGALGALFGAAAGGGKGAAIGAGVGATAGVASSAASPDGKVIIPPESVLTFHLAEAANVQTVSEQEMARLSYAAGPGAPQPVVVRRRYYPGPYYAPYPYPRY